MFWGVPSAIPDCKLENTTRTPFKTLVKYQLIQLRFYRYALLRVHFSKMRAESSIFGTLVTKPE